MYYFQFSYEYVKAKHEELLKEAETERMIRKSQFKSPRSLNGYCFILSHFGKIMVNLGTSLQQRYDGISCTQSTKPLLKIK